MKENFEELRKGYEEVQMSVVISSYNSAKAKSKEGQIKDSNSELLKKFN